MQPNILPFIPARFRNSPDVLEFFDVRKTLINNAVRNGVPEERYVQQIERMNDAACLIGESLAIDKGDNND